MDHQQALVLILIGIGGGMTYGRWRAERIKAKNTMRSTWINRKAGRNPNSWRPW